MIKLLIYGDSLSNGNHGEGAYYPLFEKNNISATNRAVGSSGLCLNTPSSMLSQLEKFDDRNYDVVLIWHGTNDWYWGSGMDEFSSSIKKAVEIIRRRNPSALIFWCGPLYRYEAPDGKDDRVDAFSCENKVGFTLSHYRDTLKKECLLLGVDYVEMNALIQIHSHNRDEFLEDSVHPNKYGYERIGRALLSKIRELLYIKSGEMI